jgi:acetoin utilization deacetylase AcuC-like enzyme
LTAGDEMIDRFPMRDQLQDIAARDASGKELARVHEPAYIRRIEATREKSFTMLDPDTGACSRSYAAAVRAAGGTLAAADAVSDGGYAAAFALVRPPGHHAEAGRAMGFCLFNNVAVAAEHALRSRGLERVLIVDWDVHHGNGTMHSFYDSSRVHYFSVHQYPHYPGTGLSEETGRGGGAGHTVNVPFPSGQGDDEYLAAFHRVLVPIALEYRPELILVSAGFDTHETDPLAGMAVTNEGFSEMTRTIVRISRECCPGRIVLALEGGYNLEALGQGISSVLAALLAEEAPGTGHDADESGSAVRSIHPAAERAIAATLAAQGEFWKSL